VSNTNPYNQYKQTQITTANQGKLIVMLYDGAIKFLNIAVDNLNPRTYDVVNNNIIKAQDIITELLLSLNMDEGGEISQNLFNLYMYFKKQLLEANIKKDGEMLKQTIKLLKIKNIYPAKRDKKRGKNRPPKAVAKIEQPKHQPKTSR